MRRRSFLALLPLAACQQAAPLPELGEIPPFEFTNSDGQPFSSAQLQGKVWVADFFFTHCPGPCPRMASQLLEVQTATASLPNVRFVSITVDPARDTPEILAPYAARAKAIPGRWFFLTGAKDKIETLMTKSFFLGFDGELTNHSTRFALIDDKMKIRGFYDSFAKESITKLTVDLKSLHDRT